MSLSRGDKRKIYTIVAECKDGGAELANLLEEAMEADLAMVASEIRAEIRAFRWQMVGIVALAMVINAGMIGLGITVGVGKNSFAMQQGDAPRMERRAAEPYAPAPNPDFKIAPDPN